MRFALGALLAAVSIITTGLVPGGVAAADLAFRPAGEGFFGFDTGILRGKIQADGKSQGITTMVHVPSGKELAWGAPNPGILSYYRVLGRDFRFGDSPRHWPVQNKLLPGGALEITWPPAEEHPFELTAVFRWVAPDTLDTETICTPRQAMPDAEVFLSSYFSEGAETMVYAGRGMYGQGKPGFLAADHCPLIDGTYLFFPRDREASRLIYDRRWEFPPNPVQWSVTQRLAAPMAMRRAAQGGPSVLLMSPPEDCFAIAVSYNRTPQDGVASHRSIYFSLFGRDVRPDETARARLRMVVGDLTPEKAEGLYNRYSEQIKTAGLRSSAP